jgi:hypothetical protein
MLPLEPFGVLPHPSDLTVSGQASRQGVSQGGRQAGRLELVWRLAGDLEAFWGFAGQQAYWELNLAPSGDWNLYRLSHYRGPLVPMALAVAPPWQLRRTARELEMEVELDLSEVAGRKTPRRQVFPWRSA